MSASARNVQATPGIRQMGATVFALVLAVALAIALAYGLLMAPKAQTAPAAGAAPAQWDHGTSLDTAPAAGAAQWDHGSSIDTAPIVVDAGSGSEGSNGFRGRFDQ